MTLAEIRNEIEQLPASQVAELFTWLEERHTQLWDRQIEEDLEAGRVDGLLAKVERTTRLVWPVNSANRK